MPISVLSVARQITLLQGRILIGELYQYRSQLLVRKRGLSMLCIAAATLRVSLAGFDYPVTERFQFCGAGHLTIENSDADIEYAQGL